MHREGVARDATTLVFLLATAVGACPASASPSYAAPSAATRPATWATHTPRQATPTAVPSAEARAREPLSQRDVRHLLERASKGKLAGRELSAADQARLTDAVVRLEEVARNLRATDRATATADEIEERRESLASALAEIEEITGLPPSELGALLGSDGGAAGGTDDAAP